MSRLASFCCLVLALSTGCPKQADPGLAHAVPLDLGTALASVGAMADVLAYRAVSDGDRARCAAYTIVAAVGRTGASALADTSVRPAGTLDLTRCMEVEANFSCEEGKEVSATLQWGFSIGTELVQEALTPDGRLEWPAVPVEPCPAE